MFTGLVEGLGEVKSIRHHGNYARLSIKAALQNLEIGESIAINGVCLTVEQFQGDCFTVAAFAKTLEKTNLGLLKPAKKVHLERALRVDARLGGHIVQGHVDGIGILKELRSERDNHYLRVQLPQKLHNLCIEHGSICIDGVSLTIAKLLEDSIEVNIIEHTWQHCNFQQLSISAQVNVECDVLGKYILRFTQRSQKAPLADLLKDW